MSDVIKNILISIGGAFLLYQFQVLLESDYLIRFLSESLVSLLIAVLAINSASLGIVLSKIRELLDSKEGGHDFLSTKSEMLLSIKEQLIIIFLSLLLLMVDGSKWIQNYQHVIPLIQIGVISCFVYAMLILYDTAKSIFVILSFKREE